MKKSPDLTEKIKKFLPPEGCIVDIGCGDAGFLRSLSGKGYDLIGIDPALPAASVSDSGDNLIFPQELTLRTGTAEALPLPDRSADVVVMQCVFSLCEETKALGEIKRILKPEGLLIITDLLSGLETVDLSLTCAGDTPSRDTLSCDSDTTSPDTLTCVSDMTSTDTLPRLRRLLTREDMERCFEKSFTLLSFSDEKQALIQMLIEAIFSDDGLCISCEEQAVLKTHKAGYGLWIWKNHAG